MEVECWLIRLIRKGSELGNVSDFGGAPSTALGAAGGDELRVLVCAMGRGGLPRYAARFATALAQVGGTRALLLVDAREAEVCRAIAAEQDQTVIVQALEAGGLWGSPGLIRSIWRIVHSFRPDVIHDATGVDFQIGAVLWPIVKRRRPLFVTLHDPQPHLGMGRTWRSRLARWLWVRVANCVVVHGEGCRSSAIEAGIPKHKILTTRMGELGGLARLKSNEGRPRAASGERKQKVLFFGQLRPNKGVDLLVPIADRVIAQFPEAEFIVAGSPEMGPSLRAWGWDEELRGILEQMRLRSHFEVIARFIDDSEIEGLFSDADVVLLPYKGATQSAVLMIAIGMGRPVVATDVGGIGEVVRNGETGWLAPVDVDALAERVSFALKNPELCKAIGERAHREAVQEFGWRRVAETMIESYRARTNRGIGEERSQDA